jgi:hypothetical protein
MYISNPYNIVQEASQKVANKSNFICENFLIRKGTKELNNVLAREYVLIIHPNAASVNINLVLRYGKKGEANEFPTPLNKFIKANKIIFSINLYFYCINLFK